MISMPCLSCGKLLQIPEQYAGQRGRCDGCFAEIIVPLRADTPPPLEDFYAVESARALSQHALSSRRHKSSISPATFRQGPEYIDAGGRYESDNSPATTRDSEPRTSRTLPKSDDNTFIRVFAARMANGESMSSPVDLQFYQNNAAAIEAELLSLAESKPKNGKPEESLERTQGQSEATINVQCPRCGRNLSIPYRYAGQRGRCNGCQGEICVPILSIRPRFDSPGQ